MNMCSEQIRNSLNSGIELHEVGIPKMSADFRMELPHSRIASAVAHWMLGQSGLPQ